MAKMSRCGFCFKEESSPSPNLGKLILAEQRRSEPRKSVEDDMAQVRFIVSQLLVSDQCRSEEKVFIW
jgi:hypothetical protein